MWCEPLDSPTFQHAASLQQLQKDENMYFLVGPWLIEETGSSIIHGFTYIILCFRSRLVTELANGVVLHRTVLRNNKIRSQNVHFDYHLNKKQL